MASYKDLYELCRQSWQEDWDIFRSLSAKAQTYIVVIGLVFGYSVFNLSSFTQILYGAHPPQSWLAPRPMFAIKALLLIYLVSFSAALLTTVFSLLVRTHSSLPIPEALDKYREGGPEHEEFDKAYYILSTMVMDSTTKNLKRTEAQGFWLRIAGTFLLIGSGALVLLAFLVLAFRVW